jgi:hypothetical protein
VPYRIDIRNVADDAFDRLVELGAIDVESSADGGIAALMPDAVAPEQVSNALGIDNITASPAMPRDAGSLWILSPRPVQLRRLRIVPAASAAEAGALRLGPGQRAGGATDRDGARAGPTPRTSRAIGSFRNSHVDRAGRRSGVLPAGHALRQRHIARGLGRTPASGILVSAPNFT